jgi:hypothetical protein
VSSVKVSDIPGKKPLCYAVHRDFDSFKKFCKYENIVKVRAILQWNAAPPANAPWHIPVWGNVLNVQVQIHPLPYMLLADFIQTLEMIPFPIPDPIGPVVKALDPSIKLMAMKPDPPNLMQKKALYKDKGVPVHRFAFQEAQQLMKLSNPNELVSAGKAALVEQGLSVVELDDMLGKLFPKDGDTSYEELRCVGLYPEKDLLAAILTVKKSTGYSGPLCSGGGSTEYVAFWIDFIDGAGFQYIGTATVKVHDLKTIPDEDLQYAVFLKKDLSNYQVPCEAGPRIVRLRAILSWETPPPSDNPDYVPVWGNREECRVQLDSGELVGHIPLIETVGDIGVNDIDQSLPYIDWPQATPRSAPSMFFAAPLAAR